MDEQGKIKVLIAEDNDVSRMMMVGSLETRGFKTVNASDGEAAIRVLEDNTIDLAFVDINMAPRGGFEFVRHLVVQGIDIPVVIVTGNNSTDVLQEASNLGVAKVLQKPVTPERLIETAKRILQRRGMSVDSLGTQTVETELTSDQIMEKVIELADKNAKSGKGRPFAAIVTDKDGRVLGQGANGITSRADPTAHAEVMAIRQAAENLAETSLKDCVLYCSSQPTKIGQALIESVGIEKVYYGLSHEDIGQIRDYAKPVEPVYEQICKDRVLEMFKAWQDSKKDD